MQTPASIANDPQRSNALMPSVLPTLPAKETANRFARDLIVQVTGWRFLQARGIELIAADSPEAFQINGQMRGRVQELEVRVAN
jgi:hypothetical protein